MPFLPIDQHNLANQVPCLICSCHPLQSLPDCQSCHVESTCSQSANHSFLYEFCSWVQHYNNMTWPIADSPVLLHTQHCASLFWVKIQPLRHAELQQLANSYSTHNPLCKYALPMNISHYLRSFYLTGFRAVLSIMQAFCQSNDWFPEKKNFLTHF